MSVSNLDRDEQVRQRAYELWEQAGKPEGQHEEFWHRAMAESPPEAGDTSGG